MNKKFSTLMAGLMLASAFSVADAQNPATEYKDGKYYVLGDGTGYLSVESEVGEDYGKLTYGAMDADGDSKVSLLETREALWKVTVTPGNVGEAPKFAFQNVATGLYLNISENTLGDNPVIAGSYQEWYNGVSTTFPSPYNGSSLMSYISANKVVYLDLTAGGILTAKTGTPAAGEASRLKIQPYKAATIENLSAKELNTELLVKATEDVFNLTFNKDVTEGAENLFSETALFATDGGSIPTGYVRLQVKDTENYIVVDTALHTGSEAERQLPKFTYADPKATSVDGNNVPRLQESFNFAFSYEPNTNRILIKSQEYKTRTFNPTTHAWTVQPITGEDGNAAYTGWNGTSVKNAYVRLVELSSVRELTVASESEADNSVTDWTEYDNLSYGMNTVVTLGQGLLTYQPTTVDEGLYMIKFASNANRSNATKDDYFIANLGGAFGYAEQAKNQDYDHMPAAHWYVKQNGNTDTAPISITNREFNDNVNAGYWHGTSGSLIPYQYFGESNYFQAFKTDDGKIFFTAGYLSGDTLEFIPVSAESKADKYVGYKHADEKQASVEIYNFNYLHGLSLENGLNTPSDKDSLVRVDETGAKAEFRLIPVIESDSYGLQLDEKKTGIANLVRNVYYVQAYDNSKFEGTRYLTYDKASKKYVMSTTPTPYFLKENNCIDDTHYYALVEANLFEPYYSEIKANLANDIYPAEFAGEKAADHVNDTWAKIVGTSTNYPVPFYDEDGQPIVTDNSTVALYAYMADEDGVITLQRVYKMNGTARWYAYMNKTVTNGYDFGVGYQNYIDINENVLSKLESDMYASKRVSVDDNTLDLTIANISDKWTSEIRVSAFELAVNDSPLYRRFNGQAPETYGTSANAPLNLKFFRFNNDAEYLFENYSSENAYRDGINDKSISFLGVNNAYQFEETATRSYTMYVDTAYVRNNTRMPQYLIAVKPEIVEGDTIWCNATSAHHHDTLADSLACDHTVITAGFTRAMYLFNAQDSIDAANYDYQGKAAYGAQGYTRLAFKDAVHAGDTLYILNPGVTTEQLIATDLKDGDLFSERIFLGNNMHKNVVFQFRLIDSDNNRFLIESEAEENGAAVLNKDLKNVSIAPMAGGWVKVQNGVPVIARYQDFNEAIAQADVFDVNDEIKYDAVDNEEIAVEGVSVVAGNGQVTIMGAAGKNVTITNILGKVVASQVIASDNATIAVPAGIVAVAVEGEAAVKAIVK